jgi:hypothetical protein
MMIVDAVTDCLSQQISQSSVDITKYYSGYGRFEAFKAVTMNNVLFWDVALCRWR